MLLLLASARLASAQRFEVIDLPTPGGNRGKAYGISESGTVAGWAELENKANAVLWRPGELVDLGQAQGYNVSEAIAVNDVDQVAGQTELSAQSYEAHRWANGVWTPLGALPGHADSIPEDIDSEGRVVGRSWTLGQSQPPSHGFLWEDGVMIDLGTLGGYSHGEGINEFGQVVGVSAILLPDGTPEGERAFLWQGGVMSNLGVLPDRDYSAARDINELGDVVGSSWTLTSQFVSADRATLWLNGGEQIVDLGRTPGPPVCVQDFPFWTDNVARAINNRRQIVGHAQCVVSGAAKAAFFWEDGVMHNLNDLIPPGSDWNLLNAQDINDAGQIVGFGVRETNPDYLRPFLLNPIVECIDDLDCDDGRFCDGAETCAQGRCQAGGDPCPSQSCDELDDSCVPLVCDGDRVCDPGETGCDCPTDCARGCGDGCCSSWEDCTSCSDDCGDCAGGGGDAGVDAPLDGSLADGAGSAPDGGSDAFVDAASDAAPADGQEPTVDAGSDAALDAGTDATADGPIADGVGPDPDAASDPPVDGRDPAHDVGTTADGPIADGAGPDPDAATDATIDSRGAPEIDGSGSGPDEGVARLADASPENTAPLGTGTGDACACRLASPPHGGPSGLGWLLLALPLAGVRRRVGRAPTGHGKSSTIRIAGGSRPLDGRVAPFTARSR